MAKRYDQMISLVQKIKPKTIVEVGVHRGMRASKLCRTALELNAVKYTGYDVFETMGAEFQEAALNGKGEPTEAAARRRLDDIEGKFSYQFVIGDTRDTLHGQDVKADFAFIDGDHRVDAIAGDYDALKNCKCVVFDDFYCLDAQGNLPDLSLYGANKTVDALIADGREVQILPVGDQCKHGGNSHLAVVWL